MRRRTSEGRFAERVLRGVDDAGGEERIVIWIERKPGALWAVGRAVNPQHRASDEPRADDYVFEGYELDDALERANDALEDDVSVLERDGHGAGREAVHAQGGAAAPRALVLRALGSLRSRARRRPSRGSRARALRGSGGRMSSQIAAKLPTTCGRRAGRAMNQKCRCSLPSPQRQTWTRPMFSTARTARSTRWISGPSSPASSSGRSWRSWCARGWRMTITGSPVGLVQRRQEPALVAPDGVRVVALAAPAAHAALAQPRLLGVERRSQRPHADLALERKRLPFVHRRHRQPPVAVGGGARPLVELLGALPAHSGHLRSASGIGSPCGSCVG